MILLDIYLQWPSTSDGVEEQFGLFEAASVLGEAAFASANQMFLLTEQDFEAAASQLTGSIGAELT